MLSKLRRAIRAGRSTAQPLERKFRERKIRFEALESRFLLSAEIAIPPPDPHQDGGCDQGLEQTQIITQTLVLEEQQQVQILELDPSVTVTDGETDDGATQQAATDAASNDDAAVTETAVTPQTGGDASAGDQTDDDSSVADEGTNGNTAVADQADTVGDQSAAADTDTGNSADTTDTSAAVAISGNDASAALASGENDQSTTAAASPADSAVPPPLLAQQPREIIFVDPAVHDYHALIDDLLATSHQKPETSSDTVTVVEDDSVRKTDSAPPSSNTDGSETDLLSSSDDSPPVWQQSENLPANSSVIGDDTLLVVLDAERDGIDQIGEVLQAYQGVAAVHILSHGSSAALRLGSTSLNSEKLKQYADRLKAWGRALTADGDILLYGCNVANGNGGVQFVQDLGEITGADIAASNDDTGSAALGGDWQLEVSTGVIESQIPFTVGLLDSYAYLLANFDGNATALTAADNTPGDDTYFFSNGWGTDVVDGDANGPAGDTLDFLNHADGPVTQPLTFDFSSLANATVSDGANTVTASNIENYIGGAAADTLDFSGVSSNLTFTFTDTGTVTITDGTYELTATDVETIFGGSGTNTFVFENGMTFAGTVSGGSGTNNFNFENASAFNGIVNGGSGTNSFNFKNGSAFTGTVNGGTGANSFDFNDSSFAGTITGGPGINNYIFHNDVAFQKEINGVGTADTLDFTDYDGLLTFSGNTSSGFTITNADDPLYLQHPLQITHNAIEDIVGVDLSQIKITDQQQQALLTGLSELTQWSTTLQTYQEISDVLSGIGANVGVNLGNSIGIAESLDQLQLEVKQEIESNAANLLASDIQTRLDTFNLTNITFTDRAIIGDVFVDPAVSGSFAYDIVLKQGSSPSSSSISVAGAISLDDFITKANDAITNDSKLNGKLRAVKVATTDVTNNTQQFRIAFQVTSPDVTEFTLIQTSGADIGFSSNNGTHTISDLKNEIQGLGDLKVDTGSVTAHVDFVNGLPEIVFSIINLNAERESDFKIDLGKVADDLGLNFDATATVPMTTTLSTDLDLILKLYDGSNVNDSDFLFNLNELSLKGNVNTVDIDCPVDIGFLAATATGQFKLDAEISTAPYDTNPDSLKRIDPGSNTIPGEVNITVSDFELTGLTFKIDDSNVDGLGTFNEPGNELTIEGNGDPFQGRDISLNSGNFDNLGRFSEFNAASLVSQIGSIRDWFGSVSNSDIFKQVDIPFVTPTLDAIFNMADTVGNNLLYDDGGDGKDDDSTLVVDLRNALNDANLDGKLRVEGDGTRLTLIAIDPAIGSITVTDGIALGFDGTETFTDGKLTASVPAPDKGVLTSGDVHFHIQLAENTKQNDYAVTLTQTATENNLAIGNDTAKLVDENNEATFKTTQELADKLSALLSVDSNGVVITPKYDTTSKRLTFDLSFKVAEYHLDVPVDFNFDLSPIGNISTTGSPDIRLGAGVDISLTLGLDLNETPAGGGKNLEPTTKLVDLDNIDSLNDAIRPEYSVSADQAPSTTLSNPDLVDILFKDSAAALTGAPKLTFIHDDNTRDTIERSDVNNNGSWITDGFYEGQKMTVSNAGANNGTYTIDEVTAGTIYLIAGDTLSAGEASGVKVTGAAATLTENPKLNFSNILGQGVITRTDDGSWSDDGFKGDSDTSDTIKDGDYIVVDGAGVNNGVYQIESVIGKTLTLVPGATFVAATDVENVTVTVPDRIILNSGGNWSNDDFRAGQIISISGTQLNNRTFLISGLSDDGSTLFLSPDAKVTTEHLNNDQDPKDAPDLKIAGGPIIRLSENAAFTLDDGVDAVTVTVLAQTLGDNSFVSATSDNKNLFDLVNDINSALNDAGIGSKYQAEISNGRILITDISENSAEFTLTAAIDNTAHTELGFFDNQDPDTDPNTITQTADSADLLITLSDRSQYRVSLNGAETIQGVIDRIQDQTGHKVIAEIDPDSHAGLRLFQVPTLTGNPRLTFDESLNAIVREDRSWTSDHFESPLVDPNQPPQQIRIAGAADQNNGYFTVADIVDSVDGKSYLYVVEPIVNQTSVKDVRITLSSSTEDADEIFRVEALNGSKAAAKLGILKADTGTDVNNDGRVDFNDGDGIINGDAIAGASILDRIFIQDPTVTGNVFVETPDGIQVVGDFGFVSVALNGDGSFNTNLTLGLDDPTPTVPGITVNELIKSLSHLSSIVATPSIGGAQVSGESLSFSGKTVTGTSSDTWKDFEASDSSVDRYISITGAPVHADGTSNNGHYKITNINGSVLTVEREGDFTAEASDQATVRYQIGSFGLSVDVNPSFGLINENATDTRVALFDFGNPFAETDFKKTEFNLEDSEKAFVLDGEGDENGKWADRIKPGADVVAELEATVFDTNVVYVTQNSFSVTGDQRGKFELGAKVVATLSGPTQATSKIRALNYDDTADVTTIILEDDVLDNTLSSVSIATKEATSKVLSVSYDSTTNKTTVNVVDSVLTSGVTSITVDTPRPMDTLFKLPDLGNLVKFDSIGISQIIDGLVQLSDFLGQFEAFGFLSEPIPIINVSVNDVLSFADRFDAAVQEAQANPAGTLQVLENKLKEALGIPAGSDSDALGFPNRQSSIVDGNENVLTGKTISDADVADLKNNAVFLLSLDNGPSQLIKVAAGEANTIDELVGKIDDALTAAFGSQVKVRRTGSGDSGEIEFYTEGENVGEVGKSLAIHNPIDFSIYENGDMQMLRMDFGLGIGFSKGLDVSFDLGGDSGIMSGAAGLEASGAVDFNLSLGIDLNKPADVYMFDSDVSGRLEAIGDGLAFRAGIGPLGVFVNDGSVKIGGDIGGDPGQANGNKLFTFGLDFDHDPNVEAYKKISEISLGGDPDAGIQGDFVANLAGSVTATLPVYFPTATLHKGAVEFSASLALDQSGDLNTDIVKPYAVDPDGNPIAMGDLFSFDLNQLSLMDNMLLAVDGLDAFLGGLQDVLDGEVFGVPMPLIGDKLADGARFIENFREDFIPNFRDGIENLAVQDQNIVSKELFDLLGPAGLGLLKDSNNDGKVTIDDITLDTNVDVADGDLNNDYMQWNMELGQELNLGTGIGLDLGIPGLGLETKGDVNIDLGWSLNLGFGISFEDAFYLDISDDSELEVNLDVALPDFGLTGKLGFLQLDAEGNNDPVTGDPLTHFSAKFGVNVVNKKDASDQRLAFSELGDIGLEAGVAGEAVADLHLALKLNSDLAPGISGVFPKVITDFRLDWSIDGNDAEPGLQLKPFSELKGESAMNLVKSGLNDVKFEHVSLDLGSFVTDFINPVLGSVRDVTEPLQPIIDFLTTPLPVISDLGPDLTLLDIAKMTGKVNTGFIESVADLITFINALPTDAGSLLLDFGDFSIFDKSVNPDLDITNPTEDVQNKVEVPQDRTGTEADTGSDPAKTKTKSFTDKLKSAGDFNFPIINDPTQIFNLLLGKDAVLMTYDLKPLVAEFSYKQSFPVYPPLFVAILGQISAKADFAFGFDTSGIKEFADSGFTNPLLIFNGFFISDTNLPTGEFGTDVPELTLSGFLGAAAELNLGIASGGVGGGVGLNVYFDLFDPNHDGKVRIPEIVNSITNEFRYGSPALAPMAMFDVSGDVYAKLFAYIKFLFFSFDFDITPPITLLDFNIPFTRAPTLATDIGDGVLQLNMGEFASQRLNNNTTDGDETFTITGSGSTVNVSATFGGTTFVQTYSNVKKILARAGEGNDTIDLRGLGASNIEFDLDGGVGNDRILLSDSATGKAVIHGGVGDDVIVGGGGGDEIYGDAGNDNIKGNGGNDTIFGDEGEIAYLDNGDVDYTRARIKVTDGDDVIDGGENDDMIFGGGGKDDIQGGAGNDLIIGDGAILREILHITASNDVASFELTNDAALEFMIDGESYLVTLPAAETTGNVTIDDLVTDINNLLTTEGVGDRVTAGHDGDRIIFTASDGVLDLRVKGANETATSALGFTPFFKKALLLDDTNRGDGQADTLRGGAGDDVIYGGRGDDTLHGGDGNDELFGDDGFDLMYGEAGNDRLFGGADNDRISGGAGDDHIEGGAGHDRLWGDWMVDETPSGAAGSDSIWGGIGSDTIFGGAGGDFLFGDSDPDAIFGEEGNDTIDGGQGADQIFGGVGDDVITSSLGDDLIDGGSGSDDVTVNTLGGDMHSLLTVFDSGAALGDGTDTLIVNGTEEADRFLLRAARADVFDATLIDVNASLADLEARLADMGVTKNLQFDLSTLPARAFIAKLNNEDKAERINYYDNLESIIVNSLGGADFVVSDNTNAEVTINGGDGDDLFQIGQLFNSPRDTDAGIDPYDVFDTVQTTKGFLSSGINAPMTINGEDGNDSFVVFRNLKVLTLNGGDGDDDFLVKAFALEGSVDDPDRDLTDITGAGGADLIQYAVNAPVGINGGDGLDTVVVLGTEFGDDFVVTDQGIYGAGLNVNFTGIEVLKLDTAEGNDRIFILGTGADHITEIFAGDGSDAFFIGGDTPPIVSQDLLGHSGIITQQASSADARFDGVNVDGISANVGDNDEPFVRIIKNDGLLRVTEDGMLVASYSLVLTREPRATVGITAIAPRPSPNEVKNGVQYIKFVEKSGQITNAASQSITGDFVAGNFSGLTVMITDGTGKGQTRTIVNEADDTSDTLLLDTAWDTLPDGTSRYAIVSDAHQAIFDSTNWFIPQTIEVIASQDLAYEGNQIATINHLVGEYQIARDANGDIIRGPDGKPIITPVTDAPTYNDMAIPSVNVEVVDDDLPGLVIQQSDGDTRVIEGAGFGAPAPFADDYTVRLNQQPTSNVTVTLINEDGQLQLDKTTLTFTPGNWNTPQTVRVIATDDAVNEGFHYGYIKHVVTSSQTDVTLATTDTFAATGAAQARSAVLLNYAPIDKNAISTVRVGTETFGADRYRIDAKQLTLLDKDGEPLAVTDAIVVTYSYIKPGFQNVATETVSVAIGDNDAPGVLVMQSGGSTNVIEVDDTTPGADAAPFTDQYQVVLTAKPTANVVIDIAPQPTKTSGRPPFVFIADVDNVAVTELGFTESSDPTISLTSGQPAPDDGRLGGDLVFNIDLTPDDSTDATVPVTLRQADMADYQSIDDLIGGINTALKNAGLEDKIFATRDENRVVIAKVAEPQRQQVDVSTSQLIFTPDNWNIPQTVVVSAINDHVVDGGDIKVFAPIEHTVARIQGPLIINGGGGEGSDAGLGADPLRMPGESNDVGSVVEVPTDSAGNVLANQVVLDGKDIDKLGPSYFKSLDTFQPGDEHNDAKAKVIIKITSGPGEGQERVVVARNGDTFVLAEDWDTADLPTNESRYIFIRRLGQVDESQQVDVATVFHDESVADNTGTLTATRLYGLGMGPDTQMDGLTWPGGLTYSNLENLTIHMGRGDDTLNVYGAQNRDDFRTVTIVNTGAGNDEVTVDIEAQDGLVASGVVSASRSQHLRSFSATFPTDGRGLSGYVVRVTDAEGKVQERTILFNDGDTLYVDSAWANLPQVGDHFEILRHPAGLLSINTQAGNDRIDASTSTAPLIAFGGLGADRLFGGLGNDILIGDQGQIDYIDGNGNVITRLGSNDIPAPQQANPDDPENPIVIFRQTDGVFRNPSFIRSVNPARGGNDEIHGGRGADLLIGGVGADRLFGDEGNDVLIGDGGQKVILGTSRAYFETIDNFIGGDDTLDGGTGSDILFGGFGNDVLVGNFTEDIILGEYGRATVADGRVEFLLRLGQGALDLAASTWFSLYGIQPYAVQAVPVPGEAAAGIMAAAPGVAPVTVSEEARLESHYSAPAGLPPPASIPPEYHVVEKNDTLWYLADIYLGDPARWPEIWALNPDIKNPDLIFPGMKIKLPQPSPNRNGIPEQGTDSEEAAPASPDTDVQGSLDAPSGKTDVGQLALSGLGLLGLRSSQRPRYRNRNAPHTHPDGAFVFDQFRSQLRPYYLGGRQTVGNADATKQAVALEDAAFLSDSSEALTELRAAAVGNRPVIDWDANYASRSTRI